MTQNDWRLLTLANRLYHDWPLVAIEDHVRTIPTEGWRLMLAKLTCKIKGHEWRWGATEKRCARCGRSKR